MPHIGETLRDHVHMPWARPPPGQCFYAGMSSSSKRVVRRLSCETIHLLVFASERIVHFPTTLLPSRWLATMTSTRPNGGGFKLRWKLPFMTRDGSCSRSTQN